MRKSRLIVDPQKCPAPLARLLSQNDNQYPPVAAMFGVSSGNLGKWVRGIQPIPANHLRRLGELLRANGGDVPDLPMPAPAKKKGRVLDTTGWPPLIQELVAKHNNNMAAAARAMGHRTTNAINGIVSGARAFTPELKQLIQDAIDGKITPAESYIYHAKNRIAEGLDQGELGLAIVIASTDKIEGLYDAAELMGGKNVFRKKMGEHWLFITRIDEENSLRAYKTIARLVAECITP